MDEVVKKRLPASFFRLESGHEPVRDWIMSLKPADRKIVGGDLKDVEFGWPLGMPLCRSLGRGLWEVRSNLSDGTIGRVLFCTHQGQMILLHGFVKKTQKTPKADMDLARRRMKGLKQ